MKLAATRLQRRDGTRTEGRAAHRADESGRFLLLSSPSRLATHTRVFNESCVCLPLVDDLSRRPDVKMTASFFARIHRSCLALAVCGAVTLQGTTAGAQPTWPSGMSCYYNGFIRTLEGWRGSTFTALHGWASMKNWNDMLVFYSGPVAREFAAYRTGRVLAISTPLLTEEAKGQFDACARGHFDWVWREVAARLTRNGVPNTIIRLGAEANGTWTPYSINGNYAGFKACFRRAVSVMRSVQPQLRFEWSMNRSVYSSKLNTLVTQAYPGNDVVDIIGLSFYDHWPAATSQSVWDSSFKPELDFWATFARNNGKKLAFGEWGLGDARGGAFDNPLYITNMNAFFSRNRDIIAYEAYYNCGSLGTSYLVYPEQYNPRAAATYRNLW
jgi:hypothetical protein